MPPTQHILVAVDFSALDQTVISKAVTMANLYNAQLSLVHVVDNIAMPDTAYGTRISLDTPSHYALLEVEKKQLTKIADALNIAHSQCWLIWGSPEHEIVQLAKQQAIDLLVLGFHTRTGLGLLFGSTASSVLQHITCDLLAVHLPPV